MKTSRDKIRPLISLDKKNIAEETKNYNKIKKKSKCFVANDGKCRGLPLQIFNYVKRWKQKCFPSKDKCTAGRNLENGIDLPSICKIERVHQKIHSCVATFQAFRAGVLQTVRR